MNRNFICLVAVGLWAGLGAGCETTGANSPAPEPIHRSPTLSYPNLDLSSTNQVGNNTPSNKYDSALVEAIEKRWDAILATQQFKPDKTGKVVVRFFLHSDGTVSDIKVLENQVGKLLGYLCERAIKDCSPFDRWPSDMARMVGKDYREITVTFNYN